MRVKIFAGGMVRLELPLGGFGRFLAGALGEERIRRGETNETAVAQGDQIGKFGCVEIDTCKFSAVGGRAQNFSVEHAGADDVGGIFMRAGDDVAPVGFVDWLAEDGPLGHVSWYDGGGRFRFERGAAVLCEISVGGFFTCGEA